jgi:hypothetical protein
MRLGGTDPAAVFDHCVDSAYLISPFSVESLTLGLVRYIFGK